MSSESNLNQAANQNPADAELQNAAAPSNDDAANAAFGGTSDNKTMDDGEYHFVYPERSNRLYSDAQYTPHDEFTAPTRFYTPPDKKTKPPVEEPTAGRKPWVQTLCLCLACAILGGIGGGALSAQMIGQRLQTQIAALAPVPGNSGSASVENDLLGGGEHSVPITVGSYSSGDIYQLACRQTVGIQTETKTNYFGMITSTPVVGSGFVISPDGYILTNFHVIKTAITQGSPVNVLFKDGNSYAAAVVGTEEENDIAVLKIDAVGLSAVSVGNSDAIIVGETVYAVGNPLGELDFTMTTGSVSALDRAIAAESSSSAINMFQIDAAVNSGNSGGPVYNAQGQVIGVVTAKYASSGVEGLGFAIPINDAMEIAGELITKGYVSGKPAMGVQVLDVTDSMAAYYNMVVGAYVYSVTEGSAADKAGLQVSDIITRLGNETISCIDDLKYVKKSYKAGDSVEITIYRAGHYQTLTIVFDEEAPAPAVPQAQTQAVPYDDTYAPGTGTFIMPQIIQPPYGNDFW